MSRHRYLPYHTPNPKCFLNPPDPSIRQLLTLATVLSLFLGYYAMAMLAILPNSLILKLSLLPFMGWQA
jgi:hypothetical protein